MELKVCPNCGKKVLSIAKVCKHCTYSFSQSSASEQPKSVPTTSPAPTQVQVPQAQPQPQPQPRTVQPTPTPAPQPRPTAPAPPKPAPKWEPAPKSERPKMFRNIFGISGRIRRMEYFITCFVGGILLSIPILGFVALWIIIAAGIKRCHDLNLSGWFSLIPLFGFVLLFVDGKPEENDYGSSPK